MSQEQQRRRPGDEQPLNYGELFCLQGELGGQPVTPTDAAMMQAAMMGQAQEARPMQSSATMNDMAAGFVNYLHVHDIAKDDRGVSVIGTDHPGRRLLPEAIGGQVVGQFNQMAGMQAMTLPSTFREACASGTGGITIGEALEATALTAGSKPVEWSDAAAIQAAEVRASGRTTIAPGGVAATAQSAATHNARVTREEDKTTLADVLANATSKLPADRPATRKDAEGVTGAEMRNDPNLTTHPSGVAASVAAAARINQNNFNNNNRKTS